MGVSVALVVDRLDGGRDHAAPRPARPRRNEDRQALDPPQVARHQARARDALRALGPPRRQPLGALRDREPRRCCARSPFPALSMRIGAPDDGNAAKHTTQRTAYDQLAEGFGPGFNGPIQVVVEVPAPADRARRRPRPRRAAGRSRDRRGDRAGLQRRRRHRGAHRQPDHVAAGRSAPTRSSTTSGPTCCRPRCTAPTRRCRSPARRWRPT